MTEQTTIVIDQPSLWSTVGDFLQVAAAQPVPGWIALLLALGYFVRPTFSLILRLRGVSPNRDARL